jgi:hypothetical protein
MERTTFWARPTGMTTQGRNRRLTAAGLLCAGLLCAGLTGCGTAVASPSPATNTSHALGAAAPLAATAEVGCASVNQATSVTVARSVVAVEAVNPGRLRVTQRHATKVRALFGDFCAVIAHAGKPQRGFQCVAGFGNSYAGTFYDGQRVLATFDYSLRGCPRLSLTVSGQTRATTLIGKPAAAAPHLEADLAAVLGVPVSHV